MVIRLGDGRRHHVGALVVAAVPVGDQPPTHDPTAPAAAADQAQRQAQDPTDFRPKSSARSATSSLWLRRKNEAVKGAWP
jgi:hypothetical protein